MNDATQHSNQKETRHAVHPADDLDSTRHELNRCVTAKSSSSNHRRTDVKGHEASTRNEGQKETKAMKNMIQQTAGMDAGVGQESTPCPAYPVSLSGNAEQAEAQPADDAGNGGKLERVLAM
jgi:hypothetical protein